MEVQLKVTLALKADRNGSRQYGVKYVDENRTEWCKNFTEALEKLRAIKKRGTRDVASPYTRTTSVLQP